VILDSTTSTMKDLLAGAKIRFMLDDINQFSAASHDANPLHMSEVYARKTPFGERVVFGVLGGLACLGALGPRPGRRLSKISLNFNNAIPVGLDLSIETTENTPDRVGMKIQDGRRLLLGGSACFAATTDTSTRPLPLSTGKPPPLREHARNLEPSEFAENDIVKGTYAPDWRRLAAIDSLYGLQENGIRPLEIAVLMGCSYLVGMEIPGRRALFCKLSLNFTRGSAVNTESLDYEASVSRFDERLGLLQLALNFSSAGETVAEGAAWAASRQDPSDVTNETISALLPNSEALAGKVALVIGGSRGLGSSICRTLALQGCTVLFSYLRCEEDADRLCQSFSESPGNIVALRGDGSDPDWCGWAKQQILERHGRLDFLVCNACPSPKPSWLEPCATERINDYVAQGVSLVSVPLAAFLNVLQDTGGRAVIISSIFVKEPQADMPQYVSTKFAIEGLVKVAALEYERVGFLVVRPPRLSTDLTNTLLGRQGTLGTEHVAAGIVRILMRPTKAGSAQILESFA